MEEQKSFPLDYYRNYLDVDDCSRIFNCCNGRQFEAATKLDLCEFLNLRSPLVPVRILEGEKLRMCYLINQLHKHQLPPIRQMKKPWLKEILAACEISKSYYDSHSSEVYEKSGSEANKEFYRTVKSILRT